MTNLQGLYLATTQISDISLLAGLTNLQDLYLAGNQISNISPIAGLTNLQYLRLDNNQIIDISPLSGLTNLQSAYLNGNQVSNISPLSGLTNLWILSLENNLLSNIALLAGLTNLQYLYLKNNQISDISSLVGNTGLSAGDTIDLRGNPLSGDSLNTYIPQLQARGVTVYYDVVPDITFNPSSRDFGWVVVGASSAAQTITITNSGNADLVIGNITKSGANAAEFTIKNNSASNQTVVPGNSVSLQVVFSPASVNGKSATLSIPSNDPNEATVNVALSGTGRLPPVPVGGEIAPVDRTGILAMWAGLGLMLVLAVTGSLVLRKRLGS